MIEISIQKDGSAGRPRLFAQGLGHPDGYQEWDVLDGSQRIVLRVSPQGKVEIVTTTEQLSGSTGSTIAPASPVFGFRRESSTLFLGGFLPNPNDPNPNVAKVKVGIPGMRLPQFKHARDDQ